MFGRIAAAILIFGATQMPFARAADTAKPAADLKSFQAYFRQQFPDVKFDDFVNGPYTVDKGMRKHFGKLNGCRGTITEAFTRRTPQSVQDWLRCPGCGHEQYIREVWLPRFRM